MVENVGVVIGIMSVCWCKLKLHRPEENLRFLQRGCPWFSSSLQVLERDMFTRKTPKHPELDPLGIGFDRILKFARAAKIFEKNIGGVQICTPPPRCSRVNLCSSTISLKNTGFSSWQKNFFSWQILHFSPSNKMTSIRPWLWG